MGNHKCNITSFFELLGMKIKSITSKHDQQNKNNTYIVSGAAALSSGGKSMVGLIWLSETADANVDNKVRTLSSTESFVDKFTSCCSFLGPLNDKWKIW